MKYLVKCSKKDAPGTLYDEKWKADKVAREHKRRNGSQHKVKVQKVEAIINIKDEYEIL